MSEFTPSNINKRAGNDARKQAIVPNKTLLSSTALKIRSLCKNFQTTNLPNIPLVGPPTVNDCVSSVADPVLVTKITGEVIINGLSAYARHVIDNSPSFSTGDLVGTPGMGNCPDGYGFTWGYLSGPNGPFTLPGCLPGGLTPDPTINFGPALDPSSLGSITVSDGVSLGLPTNAPEWLLHSWNHILELGGNLAHIAHDLSMFHLPVTSILVVCRFINWYFAHNGETPHAKKIYDQAEWVRTNLHEPTTMTAAYVMRQATSPFRQFSSRMACGLPAHHEELMNMANSVGSMQGTCPGLYNEYAGTIQKMSLDLSKRDYIQLPNNAVRGFEKALLNFCPEFAYRRFTFHHPHPECYVARAVSMSILAHEATRNGKPNVIVAGSPYQVCSFPNVVHNHAPRLSGRDIYRHEHAYTSAQRGFSDAVSCKSTLQGCGQTFPGTNLIVPLVPDLSVKDVVTSMINNGQSEAFVLTHIPVPFLDKRINNWVDDDLDVVFRRNKGIITMYHRSSASAGYENNADAMMSWCSPTPLVPGWGIVIEELRHIGSLYLFHLKVIKGKRESYGSMFKVLQGRFYVLPILKSKARFTPDEDRHFVVPAVRFDNIVKFAAVSALSKNAYETVGNKVRGQESEIKVADKVILPRWELTSDQFNSMVTHSLIRAEMMRMEHDTFFVKGYDYVKNWHEKVYGGLLSRYWNYVKDNVTLSNTRPVKAMFDDDLQERLKDYFLAGHWNHGKMDDPYAEYGVYRIRHQHVASVAIDLPLGFTSKTDNNYVRTTPPINYHHVENDINAIEGDAQQDYVSGSWKNQVSLADMILLGNWYNNNGGRGYFFGPADKRMFGDDITSIDNHDLTRDNLALLPSTTTPTEEQIETGHQHCQHHAHDSGTVIELVESTGDDHHTATSYDTDELYTSPNQPCLDVIDTTSSSEEASEMTFLSASSNQSEVPLPKLHQFARLLEIADHIIQPERQLLDAKVDFGGEISFANPQFPTPSQLQFSEQFTSLERVHEAIATGNPIIPCPDNGAVKLVNSILLRSRSKANIPITFDVEEMAMQEISRATPREKIVKDEDLEDDDDAVKTDSGLAQVINQFYGFVKSAMSKMPRPAYRKPTLILNGIAASAKSTLARRVILGRDTIVVTPSRKLKTDWEQEVNKHEVTVVTQHMPPPDAKYGVMIIDEANLLSKGHLEAWMLLARHYGVSNVILIGDTFQHKSRKNDDSEFGVAPLIAPTIRMTNSLAMPLDALCCFLHVNGLQNDPVYVTLSKVKRSILLVDRVKPDPTDFLFFDLYTRARLSAAEVKDPNGNTMISVAQSQGSRAKKHYFTPGIKQKQMIWFSSMVATQSVLFTRHTKELVLDMAAAGFSDAFPTLALRPIIVIDGKSQSKLLAIRPRRPDDMDELLIPFHISNPGIINSAALPLDFSTGYGDRLVTVNPNPDATQLASNGIIGNILSSKFINEVINKRVQHTSRRSFKESLDLITDAAHGLISLGELGFGDEPKMKSHILGVSALGDVQMARDRYHDLRNMVLRQLNESKGVTITSQDVSDAKVMFDLYAESFMKDEYKTHAIAHFNYDYLSSRTSTFINTWNDPFGFAAHTISRKAFLKTQVKVKPGLNGGETHGQTVIANEASMSNYFAPYARLMYFGTAMTDREDFITDSGFSDDDLSKRLIETGMAARIEKFGNLQIDLTRQDSTHRPAHVLCCAMFMEYCGVPRSECDLYVMLRSMAYVKSLAENLYKAVIKWNLGSGDFLTLIANCHMMKCSIAVRYDGIRNCAGIQKGDDFICSNEGWVNSINRGAIYGRLKVTMKIDVNKPCYHAGRFLHKGNLLADPVRAFFKHFAKTHDPKTSLQELYVSFTDRKVHYTHEQAEYLKVVIPLFYDEIDGEEASYIVDLIMSLRSFKFFCSTYKYSDRCEDDIYSPEQDCAYLVAKRFRPDLKNWQLKEFRNHVSAEQLCLLFSRHGINAVRAAHPCFVERGFVGAVINKRHVYGLMPRTPSY